MSMETATFLVGILAFVAAGISAYMSARAAEKATKSQLEIHRANLQMAHATKMAEFRQAWLNELRAAMAAFQSFGVTPDLDHFAEREFFASGTKIELLMNPKDENYGELSRCLYNFLAARSVEEKFSANPVFVNVCQKILKAEWEVLKAELQDARDTPNAYDHIA